jgi:photosystem II stability/assembly factor-like uncharacterized protein
MIQTGFAYSQFIQNNKTQYEFIDKSISSRNSFQREKWFYEQRMFPNSFIPDNALRYALEQKNEMISRQGYSDNSGIWTSIGPTPGYNQYYYQVSSRIVSVRFDPNNPDIIYAAAACGGLWKSSNGGVKWSPKTDFEISLSSGAIEIDKSNSNIIYCGTGEATYWGYSYYGRGLLKSTNGGDTWTNIRNGLPEMTYFSRLVLKPGSSDILFAALGTSGLYKSTDAGMSWLQVISARCDDIIFSPEGNTAYAIGQGSGYRISTDGGITFNTFTPFTLGTRNHIALCKASPNILYAATYSDTTVCVYKSTNAGYNYSLIYNAFTGANQGWYDFYVHVNPFNSNNAYVGLVDLWRTTNGSTFTKITNTSAGPVHVDHHNMDFHPTDQQKLICANDGGVWYSTNSGTNWTNLNTELTLTQFYRIASDPVNPANIIGGTQDNGTQKTTSTLLWNVVFGGDGGEVCFDSKDSKYILAENQNNGLRRSTNGGVTWSAAATGLTGTATWIAPIISHPDSTGIFYTARQQLFKTTNYGASWFAYSSGTSGIIRELAISKSNPEIIYASVNNNLYVSKSGGKTFKSCTFNLPSRIITGINIHQDSSNIAVISFSGFGGGHIYRTLNTGNNWTNISADLPDAPVNDVMIYHPGYSTNAILAATDVGVFVSSDNGVKWKTLGTGLPNTVAMHLDMNARTNKLRIATHGRGVWEFTGNVIGVNGTGTIIPACYNLYQNYPNPFNPSTNIRYSLPNTGYVKLTVYDAGGREIAALINDKQTAGTYEVKFDASQYSSGVYFYKLETDGFIETKRMVLVK